MIGVYPGSFDPLTNGHVDIALRASKFCDTMYVAISNNINKNNLFTSDERLEMAKDVFKNHKNIIVEKFDGLLVNYMIEKKSDYIIRGLRAVSDFEYEFQMALANRNLNKEVETIFMVPSDKYIFLSSTIVRDIAKHAGEVSSLVPEIVLKKLKEKFNN